MDKLRIGEVIKAKRNEYGMTQEMLAAQLGVTKAAVSKWETAESYPDITMIPIIADIFAIPIDELFRKSERVKPPKIINCYRAGFIYESIKNKELFDHGFDVTSSINKNGYTKGDETEWKWDLWISMKSTESDFLITIQRCINPGFVVEVTSERIENGVRKEDELPDRAYICTEKIWEYKVGRDNVYMHDMFREMIAMGLKTEEEVYG